MPIRALSIPIFVVFTLLSPPCGFAATMPLPGNEQLTYKTPADWHHERTGDEVSLLIPGIDLKFAVLYLREAGEVKTQDAAEALLGEITRPYAEGSVEKAAKPIPIAGRLGCYATFTDASLVGKPDAPGNYRHGTQGVIGHDRALFLFTLLSNDLNSDRFRQALDVVTNVEFEKAAPDSTTLILPGAALAVTLAAPPFAQVKSGPTEKGYGYTASTKAGFHVSIFVEPAKVGSTGHKACADFYWEKSRENPMIDATTVQRTEGKRFHTISYRIRGEKNGVQFDVPNLNLYFAHGSHWVDVHISKFPFEEADQALLDTFVRQFHYETAATAETAPPAQ